MQICKIFQSHELVVSTVQLCTKYFIKLINVLSSTQIADVLYNGDE
jgi:hypothetical protein